uniref:Swiss cheese n=1 Tax=Strigamia maritima TaxID=126957 RepID=T1J9C2_STRMM
MLDQFYSYVFFDIHNEEETTNDIVLSLLSTIFAFFIATVSLNIMQRSLDWFMTCCAEMLGLEHSRRNLSVLQKLMYCIRRVWKKILRWFGRDVKHSTSDTAMPEDGMPSAYLEATDSATPQASELRIPELLAASIKMFGNFDNPLVQDLCKSMKSRIVQAGMHIFQPGDPYDSIFIVHTGKLRVYIMQVDGVELTLKVVGSGDCVASMLSYIDIVRGEPTHTLALWGKAEQDTVILQVPLAALRDLLHQRHDLLVQSVQLIAVRLHRINLTALYHYMGMSEELVDPLHRPKKVLPVYNNNDNLPGPISDQEKDIRSLSQCQVSVSPSLSQPTTPPSKKKSSASVHSSSSKYPQMDKTKIVKEGAGALKHSQSLLADISKHITIKEEVEGADSNDQIDKDNDNISVIPIPMNYKAHAREYMCRILGLDNDNELKSMIEIRDFPAGTFVLRDTSDNDVSLIFIIKGPLIVMQYLSDTAGSRPITFVTLENEAVGGMSVISGEKVALTITAEQPSKVAVISRHNVHKLINSKPEVVLHIAALTAQRFSIFVREVDFALDWTMLDSGKSLYRQGDAANVMYIVLSGRLRSVVQNEQKKRITKEYGKGDLVGIAEMLAEQERTTTVIAVRDTELVKMPAELLNTINILHPGTMQHLMRKLGMDILTTRHHSVPRTLLSQTGLATSHLSLMDSISLPNLITFSTVVVLPLYTQVPIGPFTTELYYSIKAITTVLRLTKDYVVGALGAAILDKTNDFRLTSWLGQQEDKHKLVLYQCDYDLTVWTRRCLRQADIILLVAFADQSPSLTKIEQSLDDLAVRTQKELVLLHKDVTTKPKNTMHWLSVRNWCCFHHHLRCPAHMFFSDHEKETEMYLRMYEITPNVNSDFSRLARFLTGTSVGLVLGGGGARGSAHVGIIQAMREYNVPIDMVCGVSIGALVGAMWSMEHNDIQMMLYKARQWAKTLSPWFWQIFDVTFPAVALLTGRSFNATIREAFHDTQIEDLWLPYFCVSTDITDSTYRVHNRGSLWRYVRASMTLAGYLPPMCDPIDGHMLLDGGYTNILPGEVTKPGEKESDVMQHRGRVQTILAVDVSKHDEPEFTNFGDSLSGFRVLFSWINPWGKELKVPSLPDLQSRLSLASGVRMLEKVRQDESFHYIRPPVNNFETLEFGSFEEIKVIKILVMHSHVIY